MTEQTYQILINGRQSGLKIKTSTESNAWQTAYEWLPSYKVEEISLKKVERKK